MDGESTRSRGRGRVTGDVRGRRAAAVVRSLGKSDRQCPIVDCVASLLHLKGLMQQNFSSRWDKGCLEGSV